MDFKKLSILIICIIAVVVMPVSATVLHPELVYENKTISFADLGLTGQQDVFIWQGNTLIETANTTAGYVYQPIGDYMIVVKPSLSNRWLNDPGLFLRDAVDYILAFALPLFIILGLLAICIGLARKGAGK
jgi:hypothetical protein